MTDDPSESSFVKAIELAEGRVVSVVDEGGVTYTRIWCCLEIHLGLVRTYEVYTCPKEGCEALDTSVEAWDKAGADARTLGERVARLPSVRRHAVGLTGGLCAADGGYAALQSRRQQAFPLELVHRAFAIRLQGGDASVESDRTHILNYIAGRRGDALDAPVLAECDAYDATNAMLHGAFTAAAMRLLLESGESMAASARRLACSRLRVLSLSFRDCNVFTAEGARVLATSLPPTLEELALEWPGSGVDGEASRQVLDAAVKRLALGTVRVLKLTESGVTGAIPEALGACTVLQQLMLNGNQLTGAIPEALGACTALEALVLNGNQLTGATPSGLRHLL